MKRIFRSCRLIGFVLLISFSLVSCATLMVALSVGPDFEPVEAPVSFVSTLDSIQPDWKPLMQGIDLWSADIDNPRLQFWAVRISLTHPNLQVVVGPGDVQGGSGLSIKPTTFARRYQSQVVINANPFYPSSDIEGEKRRVVGIAVSYGRVLSLPSPRYAGLVFFDTRTAGVLGQQEICLQDSGAWTQGKRILHAIGGFFIVLRNGLPKGNQVRRYARSAAGVNRQGNILYILAIDGYRQASIGATELETGKILQSLGAADGLLLDGGGSTTLVVSTPGRSYQPFNVPMHRRMPHRERAVAVCLGIRVQEATLW